MESNGKVDEKLVEYFKLGLMHSPSCRLLTSENFQGSLNVSGTFLKRKQIWTLFLDPAKPTSFILQNHMGKFLSASADGKVSLCSADPGLNEHFIISFSPNATGEISLQSEQHQFFLEWFNNEMRCFSKEPVWWGFRFASHPQIHLLSVYRDNYVRSAKGDSQLKAVQKPHNGPKFIFCLEQPHFPAISSRGVSVVPLSKEEVGRLSHIAIRTQTGLYLSADGSLVNKMDQSTLFAMSFKPNKTPIFLFQNACGEYLTVGAGGVLKVKLGARIAKREEYFSFVTPSIQIRLWAFNEKFACIKHGLSFSATRDETTKEKSIIFQLEFVGGRGTNMAELASTVSSDSNGSEVDEDLPKTNNFMITGLWRLRSASELLWQFPPTGSVQLVEKSSEKNTTFELLFIPFYEEKLEDGASKLNKVGGVVIRTIDGFSVTAKALGAISTSDRVVDSDWQPTAAEVLHISPLINRRFLILYSPIACGFLATGSRGRGDELVVDCCNTAAERWYIRRLSSGSCQLFFDNGCNNWLLLTVKDCDSVVLAPAKRGPDFEGDDAADESQFFIHLTSDKHILLRSLHQMYNELVGFLCSNPKGDVGVNKSGKLTPGCIWQI